LVAKLVNLQKFVFSPQELKLILVSDFNISYLKRNRLIDKSFYLDPLYEDLLSAMVVYVKDYFEKRAESQDLYEFIGMLKDKYIREYEDIHYFENDLFYVNFFSTVRGIAVFDGKVGLDTFADVNPKTVKLKILYTLRKIGKPMHYQELPAKVMEWFSKKAVKLNTVHNELVKNNDLFVNMGLGIYGLKEWGYEGGVVKDIIIRIFEKTGRSMTVKEICRELLREKMVSPNTVLLNLQKHKDLFVRVEKGIYELKR